MQFTGASSIGEILMGREKRVFQQNPSNSRQSIANSVGVQCIKFIPSSEPYLERHSVCQACVMNYEDKYGTIGAGLIHVHHVTPLAAIGAEYRVDPIRDLIPLCASCHHVVHRRSPPYSVAEIRYAIKQQFTRS